MWLTRRNEQGTSMLFRDRSDAGSRLARLLERFREEAPIVIALPRGGVPVGYEVARALDAPLDVWVVRKLGVPYHRELGLGAIAEGGEVYVDPRIISATGTTRAELEEVVAEEAREIERRVRRFRGGRPPPDVRRRTVIVVDDGVATGGTTRAALRAIRRAGAGHVILAVPVAAAETVAEMRSEADEVICVRAPEQLWAVGEFYADFDQLTDDEVGAILQTAQSVEERAPDASASQVTVDPPVSERAVIVIAGDVKLDGELAIPSGATGLVLFAHGSGSSRRSPRNRSVAAALGRAGIGTLLFDLLTPEEEQEDRRTGRLRFDIDLLARRLVDATDWAQSEPATQAHAIGYFGASTGAAAALVAAAERPDVVRAIVSRGGRPDLAVGRLHRVRAPTLLIVGANDATVLQLNDQAYRALRSPKELAVVEGASHLFEEPGALEEVAQLAARWFTLHLKHEPLRAAG